VDGGGSASSGDLDLTGGPGRSASGGSSILQREPPRSGHNRTLEDEADAIGEEDHLTSGSSIQGFESEAHNSDDDKF